MVICPRVVEMSRTGKMPIKVPASAQVSIEGNKITVRGPKGELDWEIPQVISVEKEDDFLRVTRASDVPTGRSMHGLSRTIIDNMVRGVTEGFEKVLEIQGVGYRAALKGKSLELQLGKSHPIKVEAPEGIEFELSSPTRIAIKGIDKQKVGQVAADIRKLRKPDSYKGKGIRYLDEHVRRKVGKVIR